MEEMNELFYKDAYCTTFKAEVVNCMEVKNGYAIELTDTAFYPEGGGQPADHGYLNDVYVKDVLRKNGVIYHYVDKPLSGVVEGKIDWNRRFDHMQQHTGEHIFSGIVHQTFGYENIGFHMGETEIILDFDGIIPVERLIELEDKANEIIYRNIKVVESFPSKSELDEFDFRSKKELTGKVRIISIEDGDVCACCGTHTRYTGEVGLIKVVSSIYKREGIRVTILCGKRALKYVQTMTSVNHNVSHLLSAKPELVDKAVEALQNSFNTKKKQLSEFVKLYLDNKIDEVNEFKKTNVLYDENLETNDLRYYVNKMIELKKCEVAIGLCKNNDSINYVIVSETVDVRPLSKELNSKFTGKGGGSKQMVQGSLNGDVKEIMEILQSF